MPSYLVQTNPTPVWGMLAAGIASTVLFVNLDNNDFITIDDNAGVQPGISYNGGVLPPGGSLSLAGNSNWYAVTDQDDSPTLQVTPNGSNWTVPIGDIAVQIAQSGLALAIAQQIAAQGLSLIGAPKALYGGLQPRTGAGIVGVTLDRFAYLPNTSNDFQQYPVWASKVGRPFNGVRRCYIQEGDTPTTSANDGNSSNSATNGFKICVSLKPFRDATNTYGNNKIPGQGNLTFAQHLTAIKATVAYLQSIATHGLEICFWHECNGNGNNGPFGSGGPYGTTTSPQDQTNFHIYHNFYQPACKIATNPSLTGDVTTAICVAAFSPNNMTGYITGCNGLDTYAVDYYSQDFNSKPTTVPPAVDAVRTLAITDSKKFGYWEIGLTNGATNPSVVTVNNWLNDEMIAKNVAYLQAGHIMADTVWFAAPKDGTGGASRNALGSGAAGACNDPTVITNVANLFDQLSSAPSNILSVPGSSSVIVAPLEPSSGAGFAVANGLSYDITLALVSSGTPTIPFVQVRFDWFNNDAAGGIPVETQIWRCPIGNNATVGTNITGVGPQRGQFLQITLTNLDTVACTVQIQVNSTSRSTPKHDWIWDEPSSVQVHGYNMASGGSFGNALGAMNSVSIGAGGNKKYLFGMRAGNATVRFDVPAAGAGLNYVLAFEPQGDMGSAALINKILTPTDKDFNINIILPRCPISVNVINLDGGAAHNANVQITCEG
jgi:hypothetical protein